MDIPWVSVDRESLRPWLEHQSHSVEAVDFTLADPAEVRNAIVDATTPRMYHQAFRVDEYASGLMRLSLPAYQIDRHSLHPNFTALCESIDNRTAYGRENVEHREPERPAAVLEEVRSAIPSGNAAVPVIGPGGRITAYRSQEAAVMEITIRKRGQRLRSRWRPFDDIQRRLESEVPQAAVVTAAFGYYESSKYEVQRVLRLAYAFLIENGAREAGPRWRRAIFEPATAIAELSLWDGLEDWAEA